MTICGNKPRSKIVIGILNKLNRKLTDATIFYRYTHWNNDEVSIRKKGNKYGTFFYLKDAIEANKRDRSVIIDNMIEETKAYRDVDIK